MGGVAKLAKELGFRVSGCDSRIYPPMSDQLAALGIELREGYLPGHLDELKPDRVVIGNALSRGNPLVERILDDDLPYYSGPEWLATEVLRGRWVLAVAGTHGKTTTSSLLAWILDQAGLSPGFLIGGVPENFGTSARLGDGACFVVEADEYDTAFFDKRSKFVHYHPRTLVLNNLEYDHADIFDDLDAIIRQFHHLIRTVPGGGRLIVNGNDDNLRRVLDLGCWTPAQYFGETGQDWSPAAAGHPPGTFSLRGPGGIEVLYHWRLMADYNILNATAALAAAHHAGVQPADARQAIETFKSVKRRLEVVAEVDGITVFDDFAHHPTAIRGTLSALASPRGGRLVCILEPRSNTMRLGVHKDALREALALADSAFVFQSPEIQWDVHELETASVVVVNDTAAIIERVLAEIRPGDRIVIMSNGGFEDLTRRLVERLKC